MHRSILVNGDADSHVSPLDRGIQYGDGLFETIPVIDGCPHDWNDHMARLNRGCEQLALPKPDCAMLFQECLSLCPSDGRGVLKIVWTRGVGQRGYRWSIPVIPTRIISWHAWPAYPTEWRKEGVTVRVCNTRLGQNEHLAGVKHLNRLEQVLARSEWQEAHIAEGLMLDTQGWLIEGTMTNVFLAQASTLCTPDLQLAGVRGVARSNILSNAAKLGFECRIAALTMDDLRQSDEAFLCNSLLGIWPIKCVLGDEVHRFASTEVARHLAGKLFDHLG